MYIVAHVALLPDTKLQRLVIIMTIMRENYPMKTK